MSNRRRVLFLVGVMVVIGIMLMPNVLSSIGKMVSSEEYDFNLLQDHFSEDIYQNFVECCAQQLPEGTTLDEFYLSQLDNKWFTNHCITPDSIECKSYKVAYCSKDINWPNENPDSEQDFQIYSEKKYEFQSCIHKSVQALQAKDKRENDFYAILLLIVIPGIILISLITLLILKHRSKNKTQFRFWIILVIIIGIIYLLFFVSQLRIGMG